MAPTCPVKQTAGRESAQDRLVRMGIDVATFVIWELKKPELTPFSHIKFLNRKFPALCGSCLWYQIYVVKC